MKRLDEAKLTSQGQVSIPKKVRERMHLKPGAKLVFYEERGRIFIEEVEAPIEFTKEEWKRFLAKTEREPVTTVIGKKAALEHLDKILKKK